MGSELVLVGLLVLALLILLLLGVEIAWAVGIAALIGLVYFVNEPVDQIAWISFRSLTSFTYLAVPLFAFMGSILANSGIAEKLFEGIEKWSTKRTGGLVSSVIVGNAVFAAMCGSTMAATATFSKIALPAMEKRGYSRSLSSGSVVAGSILAPLIPPSILLIIYGGWQGVSIARLLAGGMIPGILLTTLFIILVIFIALIFPRMIPDTPKYSLKTKFSALLKALPFVVIIVGVLGVIFGGIMTASEAAAMGAALSIFLVIGYRKFNFKILRVSLIDAAKITSMGMFILVTATVLSHVLNVTGVVPATKDFILSLPISKYSVLVLFIVAYLMMGTLFDSWTMLFISFPLVMPIITSLGFDPVWFGVLYVIAGEQSTITPPFGLSLFVLKSVNPDYKMGTIAKGAAPFLIPIYINIALLIIFPQIVLWLPNVLFN